ncbi:MAG: helix-turn-helix transcriptional regulator [Clostridia bacterium]|nr:helix-turn-helix transcriptional regulator [Clostridia bacterium]
MELYYYNRHDYDTVIPLAEMQMPFHDLTILLDGEMIYHVNGVRVTLHDGDMIFVPKGAVRTREEVQNSRYVSYNFWDEAQEIFPLLLQGTLSNAALHTVYAFDEARKTTFNLSEPRLILLLRSLLEEIGYQLRLQKESALVKEIKSYLHEHLRERITLANVAQHVFFSVPYVEKVFKDETGVSVIRYLIEQRLSLAKTLLMDVSLPLRAVAERSGFPDYNFFSRTFKKYVGCAPLAYRNNHSVIPKK